MSLKVVLTHSLSLVLGLCIGVGGTLYIQQRPPEKQLVSSPYSLATVRMNDVRSLSFSFTETTTIYEITVNEGYCEVLDPNGGTMVLPRTFLLGSSFSPIIECSLKVVRVSVETDKVVFTH